MSEDRAGLGAGFELSGGGGFVAESEIVKTPVELRAGDGLKVNYGTVTDRVDMVLGRNPNTKDRTEFDKDTGVGLKVILRDEKGQPIKTMPRRALGVRYAAGKWQFSNLKTGEKVVVKSESDLGNFAVDTAPGYELRVGGLSGKSGESGMRITSFIFSKKEGGI